MPQLFHYWKRKYTVYAEAGLKHKSSKENDNLIKRLEKENEALKILLAEKQLESQLKDNILKKSTQS